MEGAKQRWLFVGTKNKDITQIRWDWTGGNPVHRLDQTAVLNDNHKNYRFYKTTIKRKLHSTVIDFEKNIATQLTEAIVWPSDPISDYWRRLTNIQTFIDANLWDEARVLEELYTKEGTAAPIAKRIFLNKKYNRSRWTIISRANTLSFYSWMPY
jgi:hypothetical protein